MKIPFTNIEVGRGSGVDNLQNVDKKRPDSGAIYKTVIQTQLTRSRANIGKWVGAVALAESIKTPDRTELIRLFKEVDRDPHLRSLMSTRTNAVLSTPYFLRKKGDAERDVDQTLKIQNEWFVRFLELTIEARFYGYSLIQLDEIVDDKFKSVELVPREYVVPEMSSVRLKLASKEMKSFIDPPYSDWCVGVGDRFDLGVMNNAIPFLIYKKDVLAAWSEYADLFGAPIRIGRTDVQNNVKRENMNDMLENMGSMSWGTFDINDTLELIESNNRDAYNVFKEMATTVNSEISKLFVGQTGTTDEKSFVGSVEAHERTFNTYTAADKRFVSNAVNNKLIPLMVLHGMIPDGFEFAFDYTEKLTLDQKRDAVKTFAPFFEISPEWITEQFGTPIDAVKTSGGFSDPTNGLTNSQRVLVATTKLYEQAKGKK
jgi:phage gp29-like protein